MGTTGSDYDATPERYRLGMRLASRYTLGESLYDRVGRRFAGEPDGPMLDIGAGEGPLRAALGSRGGQLVGLDRSLTMLAAHDGPVVAGEAAKLPFADGSFVAVAAINVLDHLADPRAAITD